MLNPKNQNLFTAKNKPNKCNTKTKYLRYAHYYLLLHAQIFHLYEMLFTISPDDAQHLRRDKQIENFLNGNNNNKI